MSPLNVSPRDRVLVVALLLLAVAGAIALERLSPKERTGGPLEQPSTFFSADYGTKAAYTALDRLGYPTRRLRAPLTLASLAGVRTLFVLGPVLPLDRGEERAVLDWVGAGHVLVVSRSRLEPFSHWLDGASLEGGPPDPGAATLDRDEPLMQGIGRLSMTGRLQETLGGPAKGPLEHGETALFWKDARGTLGLRITHGNGFVIAFASAAPLSNHGLREADNALLLDGLARLASATDTTGAVAFDEYHLGFGDQNASPVALVKLVMTERFRPGVLQALLVLGLAIVGAVWRFGSPIPRAFSRRRQHGEFAEAGGRLLLESGAGLLVLGKLLSHHRLWALAHTGLPPTIADAELDAELTRRSGLDVAALLTECRHGAGSPKEVLRASRVLYRVRKALSHGTR